MGKNVSMGFLKGVGGNSTWVTSTLGEKKWTAEKNIRGTLETES